MVVLDRSVRGARRVNCVLSAVREFIRFAVSTGLADPVALEPLYDVVADWDLPLELRGEGQARWRSRARHAGCVRPSRSWTRLRRRRSWGCCRRARTPGIGSSSWRMGLRWGALTGVRREDVP